MGPAPAGGNAKRWLKPGVDFAKYNKFMVDSVTFFFAEEAEYKGIDAHEMKELADAFNVEMVNALKEKYQIVGEPGPTVSRIRIAITNFKPSKPGVSAITSVVPVGLGVSLLKRGTTGGWSGGGEIGAEFMVLDSKTNEVIAIGMDERHAEFAERFSKTGAAKEAFKYWARRARIAIDSLQEKSN